MGRGFFFAIFQVFFATFLAQVFICNLLWVAIEPDSFLQPARFRQVFFCHSEIPRAWPRFFFATQRFFFATGRFFSATARFFCHLLGCRDSPCPWCYRPLYIHPQTPPPPPDGVHPRPGVRRRPPLHASSPGQPPLGAPIVLYIAPNKPTQSPSEWHPVSDPIQDSV